MKINFYNRGQSLIGIIIVLVIAGLISGGVYYYLSKQIPEVPEIVEKPAEEEVVKPEEAVLPPTEEIAPEENPTTSLEKVTPKPEPEKSIIQKCTDGTIYSQCSTNKPKYCDNGNLINKCNNCGCPEGTNCQNEECKITRTTCLKSGVCVNDDILLIVQKEGGPFITYGTLHVPTQPGELVVDREVTKFYSQSVNDEADFLIVFKDFDSAPSWAYDISIKRNIAGIGVGGNMDSSNWYGTKGDLKDLVIMPNIMQFRQSEQFERQLIDLVHEIGHYWLMYLLDSKLPISDGIHYSDCFQNGNINYADIMGKTIWNQESANDFISPFPSNKTADYRFTTLSLYLMGLIPKESVSSMYFIKPSDGSNNCMVDFYDNYYHVTGAKKEVTIEDLVGIYGERIPNYLSSQKNFKIQFALVAHENSGLKQEDVNKFQEFINEFEDYFNLAVFDKARVDVAPFK